MTATVKTLAAAAQSAGLEPPVMIVIGRVVALREKLNWFERRPLFGRRIVVTRARAQASEFAALLEEQGAEVIEVPTLRIEPPTDPGAAARRASRGRARHSTGSRSPASTPWSCSSTRWPRPGWTRARWRRSRVAAIGPATAERLAQYGIRADVQPGTFTTAAVVAALASADDLKGRRVLCPRSDIAPPELTDALRERGAAVTEVVAYRTVPDDSNAAQREGPAPARRGPLADLHEFLDGPVLLLRRRAPGAGFPADPGSPASGRRLPPRCASCGLTAAVEAKEHTIPGLLDVIVQSETAH